MRVGPQPPARRTHIGLFSEHSDQYYLRSMLRLLELKTMCRYKSPILNFGVLGLGAVKRQK